MTTTTNSVHSLLQLRCLCGTLVLASAAAGQTQLWVTQFGTPASEFAAGVTSDGAGGAYVCGGTEGSLSGPNAGFFDAWLARLDHAGNQVWSTQFGTLADDFAFDAACDGAGGAYLCGRTDGNLGGPSAGSEDAWLARHDQAGNQVWVIQLGTNMSDRAVDVEPDGASGVFVTGSTGGSLGGPNPGTVPGTFDAWLARYDAAGNRTWITQIGSSGNDACNALASDGTGGAFVAGSTTGNLAGPNPGLVAAWVARFDAAGSLQWIRQFGGSGGDIFYNALSDGAGGVYLSGNRAIGNSTAVLARYDGAGNRLWVRFIGTSSPHGGGPLAADGSGGVIVTGTTAGSLGGPSAGNVDVWLANYDSAGNQVWITQFGTTEDDEVGGIVTDGAGGMFVTGSTSGSLGGPNAGGWDIWGAQFSGLSMTRYCSPAVGNSTGMSGQISANGSPMAAANNLTLIATRIPDGSFGFFLTSRTSAMVPNPGGSQGILCLGPPIGRYVAPGQIMAATNGSIILSVDLTQHPTPTGLVTVVSGDTWFFQLWHRDAVGGIATSNFTDTISVSFL